MRSRKTSLVAEPHANFRQVIDASLHLMNYRARAIGASIEIRGGATGGTVVTCRVRNVPPGKRSC